MHFQGKIFFVFVFKLMMFYKLDRCCSLQFHLDELQMCWVLLTQIKSLPANNPVIVSTHKLWMTSYLSCCLIVGNMLFQELISCINIIVCAPNVNQPWLFIFQITTFTKPSVLPHYMYVLICQPVTEVNMLEAVAEISAFQSI